MTTETFEEQKVTYTLELNGKFYIVMNVPARVCIETGEQLFAPAVVEKIQQMILGNQPPQRMVETPVFEFAA